MTPKRKPRRAWIIKSKVRFCPLSEDEKTGLRVAATRGATHSTVNSDAVRRLLDQHDLFAQAAMSAAWLLEECDKLGLERNPRDKKTPLTIEKAMGATRIACENLDDCGLGLPPKESESCES